MDDVRLAESVRGLLDSLAARDAFSGAVLVARGDTILLQEARGYAIQPQVLANRVDTKFNLASVTKMLTAIAVLRQVAAGRLDLHAPVAHYNPSLPYAQEITIHQSNYDRPAARTVVNAIADWLVE